MCNVFYKRFSAWNYAILCSALSKYDRFSLCNETSVGAFVDELNAAVTQCIDLALLSRHIKKHKYLTWLSAK